MDIQIVSHREPEVLDLSAFVRLARFALEREEAPEACVVSIAVVGVEEIAELNERYREVAGPTDVLSFPCDDPAAMVADGEPVTLGDIVIAPEIAEANARAYAKSIESELNLLLVHGVLHLLGYDHIEAADAEAMEDREQAILEAWEINQ
ncbi:MAG: rRNA maturation RNase YbeY [Actinomycetia bacterium]|nr:rRNA maturation RNase YbeY [Actinomycetes bacterium]